MKIKVYNLEGKESSEMDLDDKIFGVKIKPEVVHEVFVAQMNNSREPWADTKTRGEVRGGGKKPWQQKGTGRARHGSIRSPIWVGGGVTFGPLSTRNYKSKINKNTRRVALKMCLSDKAQSGALWVVENFSFTEPKTKIFASFMKKIPVAQKSFLILTGESDGQVYRMSRNLKKIESIPAREASVVSVLNKQAIITSKSGIAELENILSKKA
ncbi:MAG: 50S ribosomal protein L4 [Candidatus Magasanikbacteria bacterium]|nr:50S ribosomal protein L4 [Candidatus Magasanikbacteria bacterium]